MRLGCPACWSTKATMRVTVYVEVTYRPWWPNQKESDISARMKGLSFGLSFATPKVDLSEGRQEFRSSPPP
ncbi:hypothetical protein Krac_7007 [Ktedonobacter racemifer DSM 44963]|uniref:Uncharacterized protein n=1 Tax=Ktedonobacter racemifer DSM 44963 TaxID=485913 RepID=D6TQC1_KTERA|nr:hypothetical protein Krac_7007 [Ktedonobacter racemifer DSM 44963]